MLSSVAQSKEDRHIGRKQKACKFDWGSEYEICEA